MSKSVTTRPYAKRCGTCRWYWRQNEAVGDCRIFLRDVLWEAVHGCATYERNANA